MNAKEKEKCLCTLNGRTAKCKYAALDEERLKFGLKVP